MNLLQLRAASRQRADEEADGFITNGELNNYINQGSRYIYTQMVQRFEDYFIIPGEVSNGGVFNTVADQQLYAMPSQLHKLVKVEMRSSTSNNERDYYRIRRVNIANYDASARSPALLSGNGFSFGYYIAGSKIGLRPIPSAQTQTIRIWYVPFIPLLALDVDSPEIPEMYHDFIADYAAIKMLSKSGEGIYPEKMGEFNISLKNLLDTIESRDQQAEQMTFLDDDESQDIWSNRFPWGQ